MQYAPTHSDEKRKPVRFQRYPDGRKTRTAEVGRLGTYAVPPDTQGSADGLTDKNGKSLRICGRKKHDHFLNSYVFSVTHSAEKWGLCGHNG